MDPKVRTEIHSASTAGPQSLRQLIRQTQWYPEGSLPAQGRMTIQNPAESEVAKAFQQGERHLQRQQGRPLRIGLIVDGSRIGTNKTLVGELTFLTTGQCFWTPSQTVRDSAWALDPHLTKEAVDALSEHWRAGMQHFLHPMLVHWDKEASDEEDEPHEDKPHEDGDEAGPEALGEDGEEAVPAKDDKGSAAEPKGKQRKKPVKMAGSRLFSGRNVRLQRLSSYDLGLCLENMLQAFGTGFSDFHVEVPCFVSAYPYLH